MPHKNFNELRKTMSPARRRRNESAAREMLAQMALAELRKAAGLTQTELAKLLGVSQANIAKLERQGDIQVTTLQRIVEAIGAQLEFVVTMPGGGRVRLSRFAETVE